MVGVFLVRAAAVPQIAELQRHRAFQRAHRVVHPQRFLGREQVVRPAVLDQQRGGHSGQAVALVVGVDFVRDFFVFFARRLARVGGREPFRQVRFRIRPGRGDEAGRLPEREQSRHVALDLHAERFAALHGRRDFRVQEAAVGGQRVDEVRPRPARVGGTDRHAFPFAALPRHEAAVREADAVLQVGQLEALAAAVGDSRHADRVRLDDVPVRQEAEQVLRVVRLIALVGQVHPPFFTAGRSFARCGAAARSAPAPR